MITLKSIEQLLHLKLITEINYCNLYVFACKCKGELSGLRQFLETESHLRMIKNVFYFTLKALLVFKIFDYIWSKCISKYIVLT